MPPAGSSIVHAHLQPNAGEVPTNGQRLQLEGCRKYKLETRRDFWSDFIRGGKTKGREISCRDWVDLLVTELCSFQLPPRCDSASFRKEDRFFDFEEDDILCFLNGLSKNT